MPINEQQAEQPAAAPTVSGLARPESGDEPSGAGQSPDGNTAEQSRAGQSQPQRFPGNGSVSDRHNLPDCYLDVSGGWTPDAAPSLMDMLVDELIPQPSREALDLVNYHLAPKEATAPYKLLLASAITLLLRTEGEGATRSAGFVINQLTDACFGGAVLLASDAWRRSSRPPADGIPIVRRPNEARRFA